MSQYIHHIPGRLRIRCPKLKRNPAAAENIRAAFSGLAGVRAADVNTITGSITLTYDAAVVDGEALKARLHAHGHIHQPMAAQGDATTETTGRGSAEWITRVLATMLIEKVVEHSALALVAAII